MSRKKRVIINPNLVPNPIILPDARDKVDSVAKNRKNDSGKVSLGPESSR